MRKRIGTAAAVALLAVMLGGVVRGATAAPATVDLDLLMPNDELVIEVLDFNRPGLRLGDRLVARAPLYDITGTQRLGRAFLECVVVSNRLANTAGLFRCSYLLDLAEGDILVEGLDPAGTGSYTMAIYGGTDAYRLAAGDADFVDTPDGTEMHLRLEV
ncbi:MAG TPA: hypothetical protein VHL78_03645 [Actinomycetota bacterium]|nr:hypothetical protein [Actinomycetota bacterium]